MKANTKAATTATPPMIKTITAQLTWYLSGYSLFSGAGVGVGLVFPLEESVVVPEEESDGVVVSVEDES